MTAGSHAESSLDPIRIASATGDEVNEVLFFVLIATDFLPSAGSIAPSDREATILKLGRALQIAGIGVLKGDTWEAPNDAQPGSWSVTLTVRYDLPVTARNIGVPRGCARTAGEDPRPPQIEHYIMLAFGTLLKTL